MLQKRKLQTCSHTHSCTYTILGTWKKKPTIELCKHWATFNKVNVWKTCKLPRKPQNILKIQMNSVLTCNPLSIHGFPHWYILWHPSHSQKKKNKTFLTFRSLVMVPEWCFFRSFLIGAWTFSNSLFYKEDISNEKKK